eukprot:9485378-Pyramimonas_sp.AAC.1
MPHPPLSWPGADCVALWLETIVLALLRDLLRHFPDTRAVRAMSYSSSEVAGFVGALPQGSLGGASAERVQE